MQQQLQPVNNPTGSAALSKAKTRAKEQTKNLVVTHGRPTTTTTTTTTT
jgi:hypothetical protein